MSMIITLAAAGVTFDAGRAYMLNAKLSQAVDAAALAGGGAISIGGNGDYAAQITKYFDANFPQGYMGAAVDPPKITFDAQRNQLEVVATAKISTTLMRVLHVEEIEVSARAVVNRAVRGLELVMVLDNSGSMNGGKMKDLKQAAEVLLDVLYGDNDSFDDLYVSVVPFTGRTNVRSQVDIHPGKSPNKDYICLDLRPGIFQENDAPPSIEAFQHYSGPHSHKKNPKNYQNKVCPKAPILPLSNSKQDALDAIKAMKAKGCTRYDVGSAWGWRAISPEWQGLWAGAAPELPLAYDAPQMEKVVVIMTDGENTPDCLDDEQTQEESEQSFVNTCDMMKSNGIIVYAITLDLEEDEDTNDLFRDCSSGPKRYFESLSGQQLEQTFAAIADDLSTLRLSQ